MKCFASAVTDPNDTGTQEFMGKQEDDRAFGHVAECPLKANMF
jgi:hypothetical protein